MFVWCSERARTSSSSRTFKSLDSWSNQGRKEGRKKDKKGREEGRKKRNGGERNRKVGKEEAQDKLRKEEVTVILENLTRTVHS